MHTQTCCWRCCLLPWGLLVLQLYYVLGQLHLFCMQQLPAHNTHAVPEASVHGRECVCVCACVNVCLGACGVCCFILIPAPLVLRGSAHVCGWPAGHNDNTNVTAVCAWMRWCVVLEAGMTTSSHAQAASVEVCDQLSLSVCVGCTYKHRVCDSTAAPVCPQADCGVLHSLTSLHSYQQQTPAYACLIHPRTTLGIWYVGLLCIWQQRSVAVGLLLG